MKDFVTDEFFTQVFEKDIRPWWEQGEVFEFEGRESLKLKAYRNINPCYKKNIVIVHGYHESFYRYQEVAYEFFKKGFNIYAYDHRGQGFSPRFENFYQKDFVEHFDDYVYDLNVFIQTQVSPLEPLYIYAHSLGGLITTRFLELYPSLKIEKVVLSTPLWGLKSPLPSFLTQKMISLINFVGRGDSYVFGYPSLRGELFEWSACSTLVRFECWKKYMDTLGNKKLNGPCFHWLNEVLKGINETISNLSSIKVPLLIFGTDADTYVDFETIQTQTKKIPHAKGIFYSKVKHELWNTSDETRHHYYTEIFKFLN